EQAVVSKHARRMFFADVDDAFQKRERRGFQTTFFGATQLGDDSIDALDVVVVSKTGHGYESACLGLTKKILQLSRLEACVDGDQNRANLCERKLEDNPFGNVWRPEGDSISGLDSDVEQTACDPPRYPLEFGEVIAEPAIGINQRIVLRIIPCQRRE